jgi:D-glycero-alpha-D-manno-heptose 1-phosphate guanylyltransferase
LKEVIILAGGRGTRIQHILPGIPKCMAPIRGIPFIDYLIQYLIKEQTNHFIFSLGYLHEPIIAHINKNFPDLNTTFVVEEDALGTGGAIVKALEYASDEEVFVLNGDTYFPVSLDTMMAISRREKASLVIASTLMEKPYRYGTLSLNENNRILSFNEKKEIESGYINGGCYLLSKSQIGSNHFEKVFSFERDILEAKVSQWVMYASIQNCRFIDIGIPEDYQNAQSVIPALNSMS